MRGAACTPMALPEFCKVVDKTDRGVPVLLGSYMAAQALRSSHAGRIFVQLGLVTVSQVLASVFGCNKLLSREEAETFLQ